MSTEDIELNTQIKSNEFRANLAADLEDKVQIDAQAAISMAQQLDGMRNRLRANISQSTVEVYSLNINGVMNQFTNEIAKIDARLDGLDPSTDMERINTLLRKKEETTKEYQELLDLMFRKKHNLEDKIKNMQHEFGAVEESYNMHNMQGLSSQQKVHYYNNVTNNSRLEVVNLTQRKNEITDYGDSQQKL